MDASGLTLINFAVFAPALAGAATLFLTRSANNARTFTALLGPLVAFAALILFFVERGVGIPASETLGFPFVPSLGFDITWNPDALGLFFGLLVSGVGALIVLYARGYFGPDEDSLFRFFPTLGLFTTAMMGLVLADNMLALILFWELTSISSFLLIGWDRDNPKAVRLAVQALAVTGLGGLALLGGFVMLALAASPAGEIEWSLRSVTEALSQSPEGAAKFLPWAFLLIFLGGATKSAQWPFHFWLPGAMAAPTPVSAFLHSATMVKAGVYLFGRLFPALGTLEYWAPMLIGFGAATMLLGAFLAIRSAQLKKIFAYTTVSQLGLLTCMYGLGSVGGHDGEPNLIWPVTQILNHALYKAPLFIIAGAIMHLIGAKELHQCRGLFRAKPAIAFTGAAAAYALGGLPLTLSFTAKEAFLYQIVHAAKSDPVIWIVAGMAVLTALFNVAIFTRIVTTFASRPDPEKSHRLAHGAHAQADNPIAHYEGRERAEDPHADDHLHEHETGFWHACLWWPAAFLVLWQFALGIAPGVFEAWLRPFESHALYFEHLPNVVHPFLHPGLPLLLSGVAIAGGLLLGLSPFLRTVFADPHDALFPASMSALQRRGAVIFIGLQNGLFRRYVYVTLAALLVGLLIAGAIHPELRVVPRIAGIQGANLGTILSAVLLSGLVIGTAVILPFVRSRIARVLVLGTCGFSVTGMYLIYRAPDLALTQLMFEIISVLLFLLVLRLLPEEPKQWSRIDRAGRAAFGVIVGLVVGWVVLKVGSTADMTPGSGQLGEWFAQWTYEGPEGQRGGGGKNMVNVILVDFRGYDTFGEITVLAIAAMGVFALLSSVPRPAPGARPSRDGLEPHQLAPPTPQPNLTSVPFRTGMRLILPLSLIFAAYVFFKGHDAPGGGFIAGLVVAVSLAVFRMAEGPDALKSILPIKPATMAAIGLLFALAIGLYPLVISGGAEPFLQSNHRYIPLPGGGEYHWTSPLIFDIGVLTVVVAVSVGIINRLTEELE